MEPVVERGAEPVPVPDAGTRRSKRARAKQDDNSRSTKPKNVSPPPEVFGFSLWTLEVLKAEFTSHGIDEDNMDSVIRWFVILACASHGDNPTDFLDCAYTVTSLLRHLYGNGNGNAYPPRLISIIPQSESFRLLITLTLELHEHVTRLNPTYIPELIESTKIINPNMLADDEWFFEQGVIEAQNRQRHREQQIVHSFRSSLPDPDELSAEESKREADIVQREAEEYDAEMARQDKETSDADDPVVPYDDIIVPLINFFFQVKRRGPKNKFLKDIVVRASFIKSIIMIEVSHRLKTVNVRLIFSTLRSARLAHLQLTYALRLHPLYRHILFIAKNNRNAHSSYIAHGWRYTHISIYDEFFHPKYDSKLYLCMTRGAPPP